MKKIIFLGAMHDDPSGKSRLRRAITDLTTQCEGAPYFVAVEWAQATYNALVPKRIELKELLMSQFPTLGELASTRFADTLGYEADLCHEVETTLQPVWMLNGLSSADIQLGGYSLAERAIKVKMTNLNDWLFPRIHDFSNLGGEELLRAATSVYLEESEQLAANPDPGLDRSIRAGRDSHMFTQLQNSFTQNDGADCLGIIIVGVAHLANVNGSLFNLCFSNGFTVERLWPHAQ
jgi:hypothetical protein